MNTRFVAEDCARLIRTQSQNFGGFLNSVNGFIKRGCESL